MRNDNPYSNNETALNTQEIIKLYRSKFYWAIAWDVEGSEDDDNGEYRGDKNQQPPSLLHVKQLIESDIPEALSVLTNQWAKWIAIDFRPTLQESAAREIAKTKRLWIPLVDKLVNGLDFKDDDLDVKDQITYNVAYEAGEPRKILDSAWHSEQPLDELYAKYKKELDPILENAELKLRIRTSQLLVEMSRDWKDNSNPNTLSEINEYGVYAITPLARLLENEGDLKLRENLAQVLANIGTPEAIESIVNAVSGETRRHNTLDKYYLEPSRERSRELEVILNSFINEAKKTLTIAQRMNLILFILGILVLAAGLLGGIFVENLGIRLASVTAAIGGVAGVIVYLVKEPLKNIQNALSDMTQTEAAFTGFIRELDLNDTYIQSQYLSRGVLSEHDIEETFQRIEQARSSTMEIIETYLDDTSICNIESISPTTGKVGDEITIIGRFIHLGFFGKSKKIKITVNHNPISAEISSADNSKIVFKLPHNLGGIKGSTNIWIGVIIDGLETNNLNYYLIENSTTLNGQT